MRERGDPRGYVAPAKQQQEGDPNQIARLEHLLFQAEEAINLVRRLLQDAMEDATGGGYPGRSGASAQPEVAFLPFRRADQSRHLVETSAPGDDAAHAVKWQFMARALVRDRFGAIGHIGAGVLVRLLWANGAFVSGEELARSAGVRSRSNRVVKVYICRLRAVLTEFGLPPTAIETGRSSYRLQTEAAQLILRAIDCPPRMSVA